MTVLILRVMVSQTLAETITECHDAFSSCVRLLSGKQGEWFACLDAAKVRRSNNNNNNNNKLGWEGGAGEKGLDMEVALQKRR